MTWPHHRYAFVLLVLYGLFFIPLAFNPIERTTWAMENALSLIGVTVLVLTRNRLPFSRISYTLIFVHVMLHTLAAHYTYSLVPYDEWSQSLLGFSINEALGWERNHYDRVVHFLYGLLLAYPIRELFVRVADARGFWGYFFPLDVTMSTSMLYELLEWIVTATIGDGSSLYLGAQGDPWDAHWDMALATLGAIIAMGVTALINWRMQRDFAKEMARSLSVKRIQPLGEDELARMSRAKGDS